MSLPSLFTWKRGWNKRNLKTGQIFEIKKDAVKILKHMIADISMIAYKNCFHAYLPKCPNFYVYFCWFMTKIKNAEFTGILLYREWILIIELKTSCGTIGLEASLKFKGKRPRVKGTDNRSSQCESSRYFLVVLFCTSKDASLQHVLILLRVNYSRWF